MNYENYKKLTLEEKYKLVTEQLESFTQLVGSHLFQPTNKESQEELKMEMHKSAELLSNLDIINHPGDII